MIGIGALIFRVIILLVPVGFVVLGVVGYRRMRKGIWLLGTFGALVLFLLVGNNFLTYARGYYFLRNLSPQNVNTIFVDTRAISDPFEIAGLVSTLNDVEWSDRTSSTANPINLSIKMQSGESHQYQVIPYSGGPGAVIRSVDGGEVFSGNLLTIFEEGRAKQAQQQSQQQAALSRSYDGVGVVKSIKPDLPSIEIEHEEIADLMPAMTMEFHVRDGRILSGIEPGDRIAFTLQNGVGGLKIIVISKR